MIVLGACLTSGPASGSPLRESSAVSEPAPAKKRAQAWERSYRDRCEPYRGDPNSWRVQGPAGVDVDAFELVARFSACNWRVSLDPSGRVGAEVFFHQLTDLELPFTPSAKPKWRMARCAGDTSEVEEPNLAVRDFIAIKGGYVVGYNSGEFGGGLFLFDRFGQFQRSFTTENTVRIFQTPRGVVAFTGVAHLFTNSGHVVRLRFIDDNWQMARIALPAAPVAVLLEGEGSFLTVTGRDLVRVTPSLRVVALHRGGWGGNVAINSIARDGSGVIYLGMTFAVARLRPTRSGYREDWLAPIGPQAAAR